MRPRDYQSDSLRKIREEWKEHQSTLLCLPTGCGKTCVFSWLIHQMFPRRALVLCHRRELVQQAYEKISVITGFKTAIEMGDQRVILGDMHGDPHVVVSTVQTQTAGGDGSGRMSKWPPDYFGLLVCDESHRSVSPQWKRCLSWYKQNPRLKILGVTATPDRADEEALGQIYETVAKDYEIEDAVDDGWLVRPQQQFITVGTLDFSQIRTTAGDLNGSDLARVMEEEKNEQGMIMPSIEVAFGLPEQTLIKIDPSKWPEFLMSLNRQARTSLFFTASVKQAEITASIFNRAFPGIATWACGKTPEDERKQKLADFKAGRIRIMVNCNLYTEGFDYPGVEVIFVGKPTKSRSLYAQMLGRSLRPAENIAHELNDCDDAVARCAMIAASEKPRATIIDYAGNAGRHKLCCSADILGGNVSDDVLEAAVRTAKERGTPVDMTDIIEEEQRKADAEAARRARLVARAKYVSMTIDPFDAYQIPRPKARGWDAGRQLTEKQQALLAKQGFDPERLGYTDGKAILTELFRRWEDNQCSFKMAKILRKHGLDGNVSFEVAKQQIDEIAEREGWAKR